jgi:hypothetical protein
MYFIFIVSSIYMTEPLIVAFIVAIPSTVGAIAAVIGTILSHHNKVAIADLKIEVDGRLSTLLDASRDKGKLEERADARQRVDEGKGL